MQFIQLLENEWILTWGIILLILIFLLGSGRIAPKVLLLGMVLLSGICFWGVWVEKEALARTEMESPRPIHLLANEEPEENLSRGDEEKEESNTTRKTVEQIPTSYEEEIGKGIQIKGLYNKGLEAELKRWVWTYQKTRDEVEVEIEEDGSLAFSHVGSTRKYRYSGGTLVIKINDVECCCGERVTLPPDQNEADIKVMNQRIGEALQEEIIRNKDFIFGELKRCLQES